MNFNQIKCDYTDYRVPLYEDSYHISWYVNLE